MGGHTPPGGAPYPTVPRSYGFNFALDNRKLGDMAYPSELIMIADSRNVDTREDCCATGYVAPLPRNSCCQQNAPWGHVSFRHNDQTNVAFVVGHAKSLPKGRGDIFGNNGSTRYWQPSG